MHEHENTSSVLRNRQVFSCLKPTQVPASGSEENSASLLKRQITKHKVRGASEPFVSFVSLTCDKEAESCRVSIPLQSSQDLEEKEERSCFSKLNVDLF